MSMRFDPVTGERIQEDGAAQQEQAASSAAAQGTGDRIRPRLPEQRGEERLQIRLRAGALRARRGMAFIRTRCLEAQLRRQTVLGSRIFISRLRLNRRRKRRKQARYLPS